MATPTTEAYLYPNPLALNPAARAALPISDTRPAAPTALSRHVRSLARQWDLYGVLALILSSAGVGVYSLLHLA